MGKEATDRDCRTGSFKEKTVRNLGRIICEDIEITKKYSNSNGRINLNK